MELQKQDELKNSISVINEYLMIRGFELSDEEVEELFQYQKYVLEREEGIEFDDQMLFKIIQPYTNSPYLSYENKMGILKSAIYLYYKIRMRFDWHLDDLDLMDVCYKCYIESFGILEKDLIQTIIAKLKKEGYSNRDNIVE